MLANQRRSFLPVGVKATDRLEQFVREEADENLEEDDPYWWNLPLSEWRFQGYNFTGKYYTVLDGPEDLWIWERSPKFKVAVLYYNQNENKVK